MPFARISRSVAFLRDYQKLAPEIQEAVDAAIRGVLQDPIPRSLRFEKLQGYRKPNIYTVHVTPNHAYKMSFEKRGDVAFLRRVATHREIDRSP
jgi:mRNA-degrading endonuclease RelE of RelBE toxin-antitoxin system